MASAAGALWGALSLLAALATAAVAAGGDSSLRGGTRKFVIVFDGGSSGTRIHVFSMLPVKPGAAVPEIDLTVRAIQTKKLTPGLSRFARTGNPKGAQECIQRLIDFAHTVVPEEQRAATPALLKATAGMRGVPLEQATYVLQHVRHALGNSGYLFQDDWASVIPGKEEGGLAWVAANYLHGTFSGSSATSSLGVIEMGGGSTQVAFLVEPDEVVTSEDLYLMKTFTGDVYRVWTHSYQGYGLDYAQHRLLEANARAGVSQDPCYQVGYTHDVDSPPGNSPFSEGSGNAEECIKQIEATLFRRSATPGRPPGHYAGEVPLRGDFVATETFAYVRMNCSLPLPAPFAAVPESATSICAEPMDPGVAEVNCFATCYQTALLNRLLARSIGDVQVNVSNDVNGAELDWAVGAALVHALSVPPRGDDEDTGLWESIEAVIVAQQRGLKLLAIIVVLLCAMRLAWPAWTSAHPAWIAAHRREARSAGESPPPDAVDEPTRTPYASRTGVELARRSCEADAQAQAQEEDRFAG